MKDFFRNSNLLDYMVLKHLSHIHGNWELSWDYGLDKYIDEEDSFAKDMNELICDLENCNPPAKYHDNEDCLAEYVIKYLEWPITKVKGRWIGADYESVLTQGGFHDVNENELVTAAKGRIIAAINRKQNHFDQMEESHRKILALVLSVILYHRAKFE